MALTVTWATKVVNVPKADTVFDSIDPISGREIRNFDLSTFRDNLHLIQESEQGIAHLDIFSHNTTATISGVTLARVVEIINGYQIEFENGNYAVNLQGANSNVADVTVVNQVSVRSANSAGLIQDELDLSLVIDLITGTANSIDLAPLTLDIVLQEITITGDSGSSGVGSNEGQLGIIISSVEEELDSKLTIN